MHGFLQWNGRCGMEIFTLLKANIRHKKGSFVSIIILMILISMSLTAILSLKDNCKKGVEDALNQVNAGNLNVYIKEQNKSYELIQSVLNNDMVKDVKDYTIIPCSSQEVNGNKYKNSEWFMGKLRPEIKLLNSELNGYENNVPKLKKGEIYIPQGICTDLECSVGDIVKAHTIAGEIQLKIAGIIVEPISGSAVIGWKQVFISDEDFDKFYDECKQIETEDNTADYYFLKIYKADNCELSDSQFKRQLNLETSIIDNADGTMTKTAIIHYVSLFPDIICSILMVFIGFLMIVVLIVVWHSISTGIEMDYVNLGVLKSQGFVKRKIQTVFALQYLSAQIVGITFGMILAFPLTTAFGSVFQPITSILAESHISIGKSLLIMLGVLLVSGLFIVLITEKIGRISPVRALSGGHEEIYFDSRIKAPISKKVLAPSLALRQFTSNKRQYIGIILIVTILVFFMATIMILGNSANSKSAIEAMGEIYTELNMTFNKVIYDDTLKEIENIIEKYSVIEKKYYLNSSYFSINGEELYCLIYKNPEAIPSISKGRGPLYDNEIVITDIVADELNLKMGDKVAVSHNNKKGEYIISGLYQSMSDIGLCFAISLDGAKKLGIEDIYWAGYSLSDPSKSEQIAEYLKEKYGDIFEVQAAKIGNVNATYNIAINAMKAIIYLFSIIFVLVVVHMICSKTFLREKTDIGIYKALGFTSGNLRLQFSFRFFNCCNYRFSTWGFIQYFIDWKSSKLSSKNNRHHKLCCGAYFIYTYYADYTCMYLLLRVFIYCHKEN